MVPVPDTTDQVPAPVEEVPVRVTRLLLAHTEVGPPGFTVGGAVMLKVRLSETAVHFPLPVVVMVSTTEVGAAASVAAEGVKVVAAEVEAAKVPVPAGADHCTPEATVKVPDTAKALLLAHTVPVAGPASTVGLGVMVRILVSVTGLQKLPDVRPVRVRVTVPVVMSAAEGV